MFCSKAASSCGRAAAASLKVAVILANLRLIDIWFVWYTTNAVAIIMIHIGINSLQSAKDKKKVNYEMRCDLLYKIIN